MKTNSYFFTDLHLGSGADSKAREQAFVDCLNQITDSAKRIVLLGDIFDFWFTYHDVVPRGHIRTLGKLAQMADSGIEIHYFIGNHDMWMFDYLEKEIGVFMYSEPTTLDWDGKRFHIGHGDGLGKSDPHYNCLKKIFRNRFNQRLFSIFHPRIGFAIARNWSNQSRHAHKKEDLCYLGDDREDIYQYCKKEQNRRRENGEPLIDYFLFGHRHTPIVRPLDDALYINVGNWIDHRDYAIFDSKDILLKSFNGVL